MRIFLTLVLLFAAPLAPIGCSTPPSARVVQVQTLKTVGATVKASMQVAAQLLKDGKITWAQWEKLANFHDTKFQPAYLLAVSTVSADLSSAASPDLLALFGQLLAIAETFQPKSK